MTVLPDDLVAVAQVICPQGNRGRVKAQSLTDRRERFGELRIVTAWKDEARRSLTLADWRWQRDFVILGFAEVTGIDEAETLRDALICIRSLERAALPPGRYYYDDLIGLAVMTTAGKRLGLVEAILPTKANDVLVVAGTDGRELLLPALHSVIVGVDLAGGFLVVEPIPGLLEE